MMTGNQKALCLLGLLLVLFLVLMYMEGMAMHGASAAASTQTSMSMHPTSQSASIFSHEPSPVSTKTKRVMHTGAYRVVGTPSITADFINQVLTAYGSPATGKGQALYELGVQYGIDPAFALAFFQRESTFGKFGEAHASLSLGNLRCIPDAQCTDNYAWFPSWESGFEAWYTLIRTLYVDQWHLTTIEQIIPRYAPTADHNDEAAYIASVEHSIDVWHEGKVLV